LTDHKITIPGKMHVLENDKRNLKAGKWRPKWQIICMHHYTSSMHFLSSTGHCDLFGRIFIRSLIVIAKRVRICHLPFIHYVRGRLTHCACASTVHSRSCRLCHGCVCIICGKRAFYALRSPNAPPASPVTAFDSSPDISV